MLYWRFLWSVLLAAIAAARLGPPRVVPLAPPPCSDTSLSITPLLSPLTPLSLTPLLSPLASSHSPIPYSLLTPFTSSQIPSTSFPLTPPPFPYSGFPYPRPLLLTPPHLCYFSSPASSSNPLFLTPQPLVSLALPLIFVTLPLIFLTLPLFPLSIYLSFSSSVPLLPLHLCPSFPSPPPPFPYFGHPYPSLLLFMQWLWSSCGNVIIAITASSSDDSSCNHNRHCHHHKYRSIFQIPFNS